MGPLHGSVSLWYTLLRFGVNKRHGTPGGPAAHGPPNLQEERPMNRSARTLAVLLTLLSAASAGAAEAEASAPEAAPSDADRIDALAEEVRRLKLEIGVPETAYESHAGMGPAASKVYFTPKGLSLGGYGEIVYTHNLEPERLDQSDLLRLILYTGYRFSDRIVFNAEIEFEHAHSEKGGEVAVEFAYLDFLLHEKASVRVGNVLVPIGFINELHEPAFFHGVFRPDLERNLIPTTWNDNGVGVYGELGGGLGYKAYLLNGLQAIGDEGFTKGTWIRNGRQRGAKAVTENFAGVLNLELRRDLFTVGATAYAGRSGQGQELDGSEVSAEVVLAEAHAQLVWRGLQARAIYAVGALGDAGRVSELQGATVASRVQGGYGEVAYDVLSVLRPGGEASLSPFVRYEAMNLHAEVPEGLEADPALDTTTLTAGLTYKPLSTVAVKADYQRRASEAEDAEPATQVNLGVGYVF